MYLFYLCCAIILGAGCVYIWSATTVGKSLAFIIGGAAVLVLVASRLGAFA